MKLWQYIQGKRKGKEAHRLELESMKDPFLADALDGYDQVKGNHKKRVETLQRQISRKSSKKINIVKPLSIAAGIIIILGVGTFILTREGNLPKEVKIAYQELHIEDSVLPPPLPNKDKIDALARHERNLDNVRITTPVVESMEITVIDSMDDMMEAEMSEIVSPLAAESVRRDRIASASASKISEETADANEVSAASKENVQNIEESMDVDAAKKIQAKSSSQEEQADGVSKRNFNRYIKESLKKPTDEQCKNVKGRVKIGFYVHTNGRPYNITVKKSLCPSADKEAIRLISEGPNWAPGDKEISIDIKF